MGWGQHFIPLSPDLAWLKLGFVLAWRGEPSESYDVNALFKFPRINEGNSVNGLQFFSPGADGSIHTVGINA